MTGLARCRLGGAVPGLIARGRRGTVAAVIRAPLCCLLALGLTCSSVGRAQESAPVPAATAADGPALYDQGKYVEAARAFEKEGTHKGLYNAGMARHAAFHEALASDRWRRYLEQAEVSESEKADLERRIAGVQASLVKVRFTADAAPVSRSLVLEREGNADDAWAVSWPAGHATVEVALDAVDWQARLGGGTEAAKLVQVAVRTGVEVSVSFVTAVEPSPVVLRLGPPRALRRGVTVTWTGPATAPPEQQVRAAEARWDLAPGRWSLRAHARGYELAETALDVGGTPGEVTLALRRDRVDQARIGLGIGLGAAAGTLAVTGIVLAAGAFPELSACKENASCRQVNPQLRATDSVAVLAAGLATVIPAVTAGLGPRRRALAVEAGIGGALLTAGAIWYTNRGFAPHDRPAVPPPDGRIPPGDLASGQAAAGFLGAGLGLLSGAVIGIITYCTVQRRQGDIDACRRKSRAKK